MQPHSMCAVALAGYLWNKPVTPPFKGGGFHIEYNHPDKGSKSLYYKTVSFYETQNRLEIRVGVMRESGGLNCELQLQRPSTSDDSLITMRHSINHISGLREEFKLYGNKISQGRHHKSENYGTFSGEFSNNNSSLVLTCEVKNSNGVLIPSSYKLKTSLY